MVFPIGLDCEFHNTQPKGNTMKEYEIHLCLPDSIPSETSIPITFFAATGMPAVGDIMKVTPDQKPLIVVARHWVAKPGVTHVYLVLEEHNSSPKP